MATTRAGSPAGPPRQRRMSILDLMMMAAACALGFTMSRLWSSKVWETSFRRMFTQAEAVALITTWSVLPLSVALIPIRLRRPRPPLRRIGRQPGFQASVAGCVAVLLRFLGASCYLTPTWSGPTGWYNFFLNLDPLRTVAPAVGIAWMALALSGRWCAEPSWIDRLGRSLGVAWLLGYFLWYLVL